MLVVKRSGIEEPVSFDKITSRIRRLSSELNVDPIVIAQKVVAGLHPGVTTAKLDILAAETAAAMATQHPDFLTLAARIEVSNLQKSTPPTFYDCMLRLHAAEKISTAFWSTVVQFQDELNEAIMNNNDFHYDYMGFKTLQRGYLMEGERPQYMLMRVAIGIHGNDIVNVLQTYRHMSLKMFTHATPTLFNAGTEKPQLASCFLMPVASSTVHGIYKTLADCAQISKHAGGIGISVHDIAAHGADSNGIVPMLRVFNETARFVDQAGKRKGSFAIYLEPWHADIEDFLELKKNHGKEEKRARDLFYGLWVNDLFMQRVKDNAEWSLFCPSEAPGLSDCHSGEFHTLYEQYESEGKARKKMPAQVLWGKILTAQIETGTPYMMYKDSCNRKSNQRHLGTIKSSNLCTEIVLYTSVEETAVCNLASIALPKFVAQMEFDFEGLYQAVRMVTFNLNRVIDRTYYPTDEARTSNLRHRPLGIGVQGLADVFMRLQLPFDSDAAFELNRQIFATMYYAACEQSMELASVDGTYETYQGSPMSCGQLQPDLWDTELPEALHWNSHLTWDKLRTGIAEYGMRNSTLLAPMPTASTSSILGNTECIEPLTSNIYARRVLSGEFAMVNKHLVKVLEGHGMWSDKVRKQIILDRGSVQSLDFPEKELFKTTWEIKQRAVMDLAIGRAPFICQHQSLNIHFATPTISKLSSLHFYGWSHGMKGSSYYVRSSPKTQAQQFTVQDCETCSS